MGRPVDPEDGFSILRLFVLLDVSGRPIGPPGWTSRRLLAFEQPADCFGVDPGDPGHAFVAIVIISFGR